MSEKGATSSAISMEIPKRNNANQLREVKQPNILQDNQFQELFKNNANKVVSSQSCIGKRATIQQFLVPQLIKPVIGKRKPPPPGFIERITTGGCRIAVPASQLNVCCNTYCQTKNLSPVQFEINTQRKPVLNSIDFPMASSTPKNNAVSVNANNNLQPTNFNVTKIPIPRSVKGLNIKNVNSNSVSIPTTTALNAMNNLNVQKTNIMKRIASTATLTDPLASQISVCKNVQNLTLSASKDLTPVASNQKSVLKTKIIQANNISRRLTRSLSRTILAPVKIESIIEESTSSNVVTNTSHTFYNKKVHSLCPSKTSAAFTHCNHLLHDSTTKKLNAAKQTVSSNITVKEAIAKIIASKQCSVTKIKRQPPPGYVIIETPDGPSIAKPAPKVLETIIEERQPPPGYIIIETPHGPSISKPAPKMLETNIEETAVSLKLGQKRKLSQVSEAGPSDKLPKMLIETTPNNSEQQSTEPSADDLFNKLIELENSFFPKDYKRETTDDITLPKWNSAASNLTPVVKIDFSTENSSKLNKSPICISSTSSEEELNESSFKHFDNSLICFNASTSSKAGIAFNQCNKENFKKSFSEDEKYAPIDSDEDALVFDPDFESDECLDSDEDLPNSKLLDSIYNASLLNRKEIFRKLRNVFCPSHRDPHFFYKQNEKSLEHVFDSLNNAPPETELAEDPEGLNVPLMKHQKHALAWMQFCEKRRPFGGLLADDMGLGKTLTVLSLIMAEKNRLENGEDETDEWSTSYGGTLVICPASLLRQWENEVNTKFNFSLMPLVFHGNVHKQDVDKLRSFDVVITTYESVINVRLARHLFNTKWRRIVLDEAHTIRNPVTQKSESVCNLRAKYRWALTGTPIHNKETDVFSILKFLRYAPFDDRAFWSSWSTDHQRLSVLLRSIMLRRTKLELQKQNVIFKLPPRTEEIMNIELSEEEMNVHQAVLSFSKVLVEQYILQSEQRKANECLGTYIVRRQDDRTSSHSKDYIEFVKKIHGDVKNIGQHVILVLLLRLTQICCHPGLAKAMLFDDDEDSTNNTKKILSDMNDQKDMKISQANTDFCMTLKNEEETKENIKASKVEPTVREILSHRNQVFHHVNPSSKMLEVMRVLKQRVINNRDKAVIVSQWTGYLSIIESYLNSEGINVLSFTGKMSLEERENALIEFNCSVGHAKVLLLSLKCGGVGLNLTAANHLILMDLHWNPQMETQAQDRIYRLGQKKPVYVYKFLCHDTIEERIKMVQDDKLKLAESVLTGATALKQGLRFSIRDLKKLFGIDEVVKN